MAARFFNEGRETVGEQPRRGWKLHFAKAQGRDKKAGGTVAEVVACAGWGRWRWMEGKENEARPFTVAPRLAVLWF